jgi:hypothetical protein
MKELTHQDVEKIAGGLCPMCPLAALMVPAAFAMIPYVTMAQDFTFKGLAITGSIGIASAALYWHITNKKGDNK